MKYLKREIMIRNPAKYGTLKVLSSSILQVSWRRGQTEGADLWIVWIERRGIEGLCGRWSGRERKTNLGKNMKWKHEEIEKKKSMKIIGWS